MNIKLKLKKKDAKLSYQLNFIICNKAQDYLNKVGNKNFNNIIRIVLNLI